MSKLLPIKSENPMELAKPAQRIKYHGYTKNLEIPIDALDNKNLIDFIFFEDSFIGLEGRMNNSNKRSNSFPILDLGI